MELKELIEGLSADKIVKVMTAIRERPNVRSVDHTRKLNSIKRTNLYFNSVVKPHQVDTHKTYTNHADSIREQVLAGGVE